METSSRLWSTAVIKPMEWSASLLLPGEDDSFAVVSVAGTFLWSGGAEPSPNYPPFSSGHGTGYGGVHTLYRIMTYILFDNTAKSQRKLLLIFVHAHLIYCTYYVYIHSNFILITYVFFINFIELCKTLSKLDSPLHLGSTGERMLHWRSVGRSNYNRVCII